MINAGQPRFFSVKEFCSAYGVGASTAYKLMRAGDLAAVKIGRQMKLAQVECERWAANLPAFKGRLAK